MKKDIKIAVAGTGYVGLSIATLLSQHHQVTAVDVIPEKVDLINSRKSPIQDEYIEKYLAEKELEPDRHTRRSQSLRRCGLRGHRRTDKLRPGEELLRHQPRGGSHRISEEGQSPCDNGHQEHHSRGVHGKPVRKIVEVGRENAASAARPEVPARE